MARIDISLVSSLEGSMVECGFCLKKWFDTYMRLDNKRGTVTPLCLDCFDKLFVYDVKKYKYVLKDCENCTLHGDLDKCKSLNCFEGVWLIFKIGSISCMSCDLWNGGERFRSDSIVMDAGDEKV